MRAVVEPPCASSVRGKPCGTRQYWRHLRHVSPPSTLPSGIEQPRASALHARASRYFPWLASLLLAVAHAQLPLFSRNQHTYFLHALARTEPGLRHDWLANTADPQPVFSWLLHESRTLFGDEVAYVWMMLATFVFACSLFRIARATFPSLPRAGLHLGFALVVLLQTGPHGLPGHRLFEGFANQYVLANHLQPCVGGVALVYAVACALERRAARFVFGLVLAASLHPTYVPASMLLALTWALERGLAARSYRAGLPVLLASALGLAPIVAYVLVTFPHPDAELAQRAACILARERIPQHALASVWFDGWHALASAAWVVGACALWRKPIGKYLAATAAMGLGLTLVVHLSGSCQAALLFPQRVSAVALPILSTLGLSFSCVWCVQRFAVTTRRAMQLGALALLSSCLLGVLGWQRAHRPLPRDFRALLAAIDQHVPVAGTLLMVPPSLREDLRLSTKRAIVTDLKSHPYRDAEVLAWSARMELASELARAPSPALLQRAASSYQATHVVSDAAWRAPDAVSLRTLFENESYRLYALSAR